MHAIDMQDADLGFTADVPVRPEQHRKVVSIQQSCCS
jgi:hypothetical protein